MNANYRDRIKKAVKDAEEFIARAKLALDAGDDCFSKPREKRAAMKRISMELTKSLANVRKGECFEP